MLSQALVAWYVIMVHGSGQQAQRSDQPTIATVESLLLQDLERWKLLDLCGYFLNILKINFFLCWK